MEKNESIGLLVDRYQIKKHWEKADLVLLIWQRI